MLRRLAPLTFLIRVQVFRDPLRGELPHVQIFINDGTNSLTWDAQFLSYWFSRNPASYKVSSWIWSIISGVVNVLCRPGRGASQVEKSPRLNWTTLFLTMVYDGACSPNVSVRMAWISFDALPFGGGRLDDSSRLHVVEIARVAWHASFQPLQQEELQFGTWTDPHLSNDTIDSVLPHREVGRAKNLSVPLRIIL